MPGIPDPAPAGPREYNMYIQYTYIQYIAFTLSVMKQTMITGD